MHRKMTAFSPFMPSRKPRRQVNLLSTLPAAIWMWVLGVCLWGGMALSALGQAEPTADLKEPASPPKEVRSVFIDNPHEGKDPFFPDSKRRIGGQVISNVPDETGPVEQTLDALWDMLALKGISHAANRRLAMVNRYTLAEGEQREIKLAGQPIWVRCVTIKERSAIIRMKGQTKELFLREDLFYKSQETKPCSNYKSLNASNHPRL